MENIKNKAVNFDLLESLGLNKLDDNNQNDYDEWNQELIIFKDNISLLLEDEAQKLESCLIDSEEYYKHYYSKVYYSNIINKFFDKDYKTHPKIRFKKIEDYLEFTMNKYEDYLISINYSHNDSESIEAFEQYNIAKKLLNDFDDNNGIEIEKDKIITLFDFVNSVLDDINCLKSSINIIWEEVYNKALILDKDENGLIRTYLDYIFNPNNTILDDKNLLLNLLFIQKMMSFENFKWCFETDFKSVTTLEIDLNNGLWNDILNNTNEENLNYVNIVNKDLQNIFNNRIIEEVMTKSDTRNFGQNDINIFNVLHDDIIFNFNFDLFIRHILSKSDEGSTLIFTNDLIKYFSDKEFKFENGNKMEFVEIWENRKLYVLNNEANGLKKLENEIFIINKNNEIVINPDKPLVYFNVNKNPFNENPIIKWYKNMDIKLKMDKSLRLKIDKNIFI